MLHLIFIFALFFGIKMYANEFKTKEKQKLTATCIFKQQSSLPEMSP